MLSPAASPAAAAAAAAAAAVAAAASSPSPSSAAPSSSAATATTAAPAQQTSAHATRHPLVEFQAVVLAGGGGADLFPLTPAAQCLALLPLANRPLLYYQLRLLQQAGFGEVIVAVEEQHRKAVQEYLAKAGFTIKVDLFHPKVLGEDDEWSTGDVLKQMAGRIFTDFFVLSGDLVAEVPLQSLADVFRTRDCSATVCLKENEPVDGKGAAPMFSWAAALEKEVTTCYGLQQSQAPQQQSGTMDARLVLVRVSERNDGACMIGRNLLDRCSQFTLNTHLSDSHVYIFKRWVLDLMLETPEFSGKGSSVKDDLIPYLVTIQHQKSFRERHPGIWEKAKSRQGLAHAMSSAAWNAPGGDDRVRVFSYISPFRKGGSAFSARASSLEAYSWMSFAVTEHASSATTPWEPFTSNMPVYQQQQQQQQQQLMDDGGSERDSGSIRSSSLERHPSKSMMKTLLGVNCIVHPTANLAKCIIGDNCYIGAGVKMNNCVLMNNCRVEDGSVLRDCLFSSFVVVGRKCTLHKCQVGSRYVFNDGFDKNAKTDVEMFCVEEDVDNNGMGGDDYYG